MANLEPMPISSLPEGDIQDGDKMVIYRETTGKAYQTDAGIIEELNADLTDYIIARIVTSESFSISAGGYAEVTTDISYSGYTALGILNIQISGGNGAGQGLIGSSNLQSSNTVARVYIHNKHASSTYEWAAIFNILYRKNI